MVYKKNGIKKILKSLTREIQKRIPVHKILLFGSQAAGTPKKFSDIDIAVISPQFEGMSYYERIKMLLDCVYQLPTDLSIDIEPFGYTPEEFEEAGHFDFLGVIKETGKVIYSA